MSESIARGRGIDKRTCQKCNRTVYVVVIDGVKVETDPELIAVVPFGVSPATEILARRKHSELCMKYQSDAARLAALQVAKREGKLEAKALKKPLPGKREPGQ